MTATTETRPLSGLARLGLLAGPLLSMIDSSIVNVAVPDIASELGASLPQVQWVVSGYLLALGVGLSLTGYLARRYGTLPVYRVSMVAFVLASAACAFAPGIGWLIGFRALQGLAGAPLIPLALSILLGKDGVGQGGKIPVSAALVLFVAPALGPTLGGLLIAVDGWWLIFLVNVPVGLLGLALGARLPRTLGAPADPGARFDPVGFVLLATGVTAVLYGASEATARGWSGPVPLPSIMTGLALLCGYGVWASRRTSPILGLQVLRGRNGALAIVLQMLCSVVAFATLFLVPVFTQSVQGHSPLATGVALLPQGVVMGLGTVIGQRVSTRVPLVRLVVSGFTLLALASLVLVLVQPETPLWVVAVLLMGRALAIGLVTVPLLTAILAPLREDELADGNTVFNVSQRLGGALGISVFASLLAAGSVDGIVDAFHLVGYLLAGLAALAGVGALFLRPSESVSGGRGRDQA